ncbi:MAG: 23S rRNA (pseudouridine(1915)-N(3))-methyltransferase RlmH [Clostridia bacterium]|nr:23S rRNA (pseudouridine(1915)-N(3))-methyltransferase RlmH [Clostridia bacterium]
MMKITLISLGKLKEKYFTDAATEYEKRLSKYCDLKIIELCPQSLPDAPSESLIKAALEKEAAAIQKAIPKGAYTVPFCIEGKKMSSEQFAKTVKDCENTGAHICFIIGSSYGLCESIKQKANLKLSLSDMTFPHKLFKVMALEQIYRAFKINEGGSYHK